jgi:Pyridoxamine 5'-phosphate oxidase
MLSPSDPVVVDFLRNSMVALFATVSAKGRPFVTPIWFVVDGGALYLTTGTGTWAARNVAQHSEVTLLLTGEGLAHSAGRSAFTARQRSTQGSHGGASSSVSPPSTTLRRAGSPRSCRTSRSGGSGRGTTRR